MGQYITGNVRVNSSAFGEIAHASTRIAEATELMARTHAEATERMARTNTEATERMARTHDAFLSLAVGLLVGNVLYSVYCYYRQRRKE